MQMQAMNHYGNQNRGFGGQPQPQRQGPRRGNNRGGPGGFRQSRFDQQQRSPNQNQGQRPNENLNKPSGQSPVQQTPPAKQDAPPQTTPNQSPVQAKPQPAPAAAKPTQPPVQQSPKPQQQQQQTTPQNNDAVPKPLMGDAVEKPGATEQANFNSSQGDNKNQQLKNVNGGFGGPNNRGSWAQGSGPNRGGGNRQFGQRQGGGPGRDNQGAGFQGGQGPRDGQGGQGQGGQGGPGGPGGQPRNQQRGPHPRGHMNDKNMPPAQREEHMLMNKLKDLVGPLVDLPPLDQTEVKFNGRSRLYIGNLTPDVTEDEINALFSQYGESAELFLNKEKNFGFIKLDYRVNAEKAKRELDGQMKNGRAMRVRFAPHNSAIRVKNLPHFVSNELLHRAFEIFGKIERAYVKVDERGKSLGEGVIEYARKPSALAAIRNCTEKCFFLTSSLRPVIVESFEEPDEFDGYPEKNLPKKHPEFLRAREVGPRFSEAGSFEHEYGTRWKQLHELHRQKEDSLKKELAAEEEKLEAQMEYAKYEHETEILREQLRQREQDRERQKRSWEMAERAAEERRESERVALQRQEEQMAQRMRQQDDELRRRQQENTLFVQAQRLNSMLDRQEQGIYDTNQSPMDGGFREQFDGRGYDDMKQGRGWDGPRQIDDFPNKRRRF